MSYPVQCAWVPGTTDRVTLYWQNAGTEISGTGFSGMEVPLRQLVRVLGRRVLDDLYLRGRTHFELAEDLLGKLRRPEAYSEA